MYYYYLMTILICQVKSQPTCDSKIYCQGVLLHTVQMSGLFEDSKDFVDMSLVTDSETILESFNKLLIDTKNNPNKEEIKDFVNQYFTNGNELENWIPNDLNPNPSIINKIINKDVREFAKNLISIWPKLGKKIKSEVAKNESQFSIINVPNGFIIPGGRFREYYYWDTYWIIRGLLISEMFQTARGMLDNFITLIKRYGFIPNGGRVYYLKRSQPPLFVSMVTEYIKKSNDVTWLENNIKYLEIELNYWIDNKMIDVEKDSVNYKLARYKPESTGPRPESYKEDYNTASGFDASKRDRIYIDIKGGAESGWDFSSRWLYDSNGLPNGNISNIQTSRTIPVDLNSFLYKAFDDLSYLYMQLKSPKAINWKIKAKRFKQSIEAVFWNKIDGIWYDYDLNLKQHRKYFSISNLTPLWVKAFNDKQKLTKLILNYLERNNIFSFIGGTPTTLQYSGEQWDYPNAWPPLQAIMVQGLANLKTQEAEEKAKMLAQNWVNANMLGFAQTGEMFEKYDAINPGSYGGGGEYTVQSGFGWTNGVALEFIETYY